MNLTSLASLSSERIGNMDSTYSDEKKISRVFPEQIQRQKLLDRQKIFSIGLSDTTATSPDSIRALMNIFYTDQFRTVNDPEAPFFMFMTKDAHLAMGIGGTINIRGWEEWNGVIDSYIFIPYYIPVQRNEARMKRLYATAANSGIYFTLLGRNTVVGDFSAYIEGRFNGYNRINFKLTTAYITLKGLTAGYTYSTFLDTQVLPRLIDGGLYGGTIDRANVLVRYRHNFRKGWSLAGGLEFPSTFINDSEPDVEACLPYLPDIACFGQYQWDEGYSHVRLSGLLRTLSYRNLIKEQNHNILGWGLALSTMIKILPELTFYGVTSYGVGHGGYVSDMSNGMHDLVGIKGKPGVLEAPKAFSYFLALKYHFRPDLYATATFTQSRNYESNPADLSGYKYGLSGSINLFWEITPRLSVGGEYMTGKRMNFNGDHGCSNRAELALRLSF
ncbi:MAG: hypothetical protein K2J15_01830 [Muribaculaceae bacterium]|nr:hypothetical protein [Muribaculaceae bacterium]